MSQVFYQNGVVCSFVSNTLKGRGVNDMDMELQSKLSFYRELSCLDDKGSVCLVKHIDTGQVFVKKVLKTYERDVYEYIKANPLPYIPAIYECIEDDGRLYVIEEFIQGITLDRFIEEYGCLETDLACRVTKSLCHILEELHGQRKPIIHRDIKPSNVIVKLNPLSRDQIDSVYLIDFNTAREYSTSAKRDTSLMGTRGFAAPEQYGFSQSDERTDIYALGVLLNYMLTGDIAANKPYKGDRRLANIIAKATDMSPEGRFQSALEFEAALSGNESDYMRFLLPGFRKKKTWHMIIGTICYAVMLWFCFTVEIHDGRTGDLVSDAELMGYRIVYFLMFFGLALLWGNYLGIWKHLPLLRKRNKWIKAVGIVIFSVLWAFSVVVAFALVDYVGLFRFS